MGVQVAPPRAIADAERRSHFDLIHKIVTRKAVVGVMGMGYVGLPLAMAFARRRIRVVGFDTDPNKVECLSRGESYIGHIPSSELSHLLERDRLDATSDFRRLGCCDCILVCVPTPLGRHRTPDLRYVRSSAKEIARALRRGQLVVLESTTYPGTTEEVVRPILERDGLSAEKDFFLAYSPEREDPGRHERSVEAVPKVVGGVTAEAVEAACALYSVVAPSVVKVSSARVAEAVKMLENTYRAVNIALVNELKLVFERMGVNIWEVIEAARTKPFGFQAFYPGPGLGGHCIPIDPFYLSWKAREVGIEARFIELAGEVNSRMPLRVVQKARRALEERGKKLQGARFLILGVAYKKDVDDDRESPAYEIIKLLVERGADVSYNDPYIPKTYGGRRHSFELESVDLTPETLSLADCVVVVTDHSAYDAEFIVEHAKLVVDTRYLTGGVGYGRERIIFA